MIEIQSKLDKSNFRARMLLQVHDELLFEVPQEEIDPMTELVVSTMEGAAELSVPLVAEWGIGKDWYSCKP